MGKKVGGNTSGLTVSELKGCEKLYTRRVEREELLPLALAREVYGLAQRLNRRVGVLLSREGDIEEVFLGKKDILYLPDLGRYRLGAGRLRRLRLVYSDLSKDPQTVTIPSDIYTDLEKLRLDMVIGVKEAQSRMKVAYAHLVPYNPAIKSNLRTEQVPDLARHELDFAEFMSELEGELSHETGTARHSNETKALLVGVYEKRFPYAESSILELKELARSAGVTIADTVIQRRDLDPKTLLGKGKLEEVVLHCLRLGAEMLIFDTELKPSQWRIITNATDLKVIDRSMLILDIFAQRASSSDGRLQVELAQLKYNLPRLVEKDAGLSRLSGGIGGRGPGETKLEIGRRVIRDKISELEKRIDQLKDQRFLRKKRRLDSAVPLVAILGYTNVGKSTLFNVLTKSTVLAEDKLFATLDPAQRRLIIPQDLGIERRDIIISDTVGFIRSLPKELANAFRATLEELHDASLLLHVVDVSDPEMQQRKENVEAILAEMGLQDLPTILVLNKCDKISEEEGQAIAAESGGILTAAAEKRGISGLLQKILAAMPLEGEAQLASRQ